MNTTRVDRRTLRATRTSCPSTQDALGGLMQTNVTICSPATALRFWQQLTAGTVVRRSEPAPEMPLEVPQAGTLPSCCRTSDPPSGAARKSSSTAEAGGVPACRSPSALLAPTSGTGSPAPNAPRPSAFPERCSPLQARPPARLQHTPHTGPGCPHPARPGRTPRRRGGDSDLPRPGTTQPRPEAPHGLAAQEAGAGRCRPRLRRLPPPPAPLTQARRPRPALTRKRLRGRHSCHVTAPGHVEGPAQTPRLPWRRRRRPCLRCAASDVTWPPR